MVEKKRRSWKTIKPEKPLEFLLPPHIRKASGLPPDPGWYQDVEQALKKCHERYDGGDKIAAFDAIEILANTFFPPWVQEFYIKAWFAYRSRQADTLDQAFGVERRKGQHIASARKREQLRESIVFRIYALHYLEGRPLDPTTFGLVGDEFGRSAGEVAKIFGEPESDELRELLRRWPITRATTKTPQIRNSRKSTRIRTIPKPT